MLIIRLFFNFLSGYADDLVPGRVRRVIVITASGIFTLNFLDPGELTAQIATELQGVTLDKGLDGLSQLSETQVNMVIYHIDVSVIVVVLFMFNQIFVEELLTLFGRTLKYISIIVYGKGTSVPATFLESQP
jgi:hypothetical protein